MAYETRVVEVKGVHICCEQCENVIFRCKTCAKDFKIGDKIFCYEGHKCENCYYEECTKHNKEYERRLKNNEV